MPCHAYLYETTLAPLQVPTVEIIAATRKHKNLDIKSNRPLGPDLWGANLIFPPQPVAYYILVYDHSRRYAPSFIGDLHAGISGRFDMILWPLPTPSLQPEIGDRPRQFTDIGPFIDRQNWSTDEKRGAQLLVEALSAENSGEITVSDAILEGWFEIAHDLSIDPRIVSLHPGTHRWAIEDYYRQHKAPDVYAAEASASGAAAASSYQQAADYSYGGWGYGAAAGTREERKEDREQEDVAR